MHSNHNVLTISESQKHKWSIGDTFKFSDLRHVHWRLTKFHGLKIRNIDFAYGLRLHFDFFEWNDNQPEIPRMPSEEETEFRFY